MADLSFMFLDITLGPIQSAYRAGHIALSKLVTEAEGAYEEHCNDVAAGNAPGVLHDDETGYEINLTEIRSHAIEAAQDALDFHCKAFATMIHHAWERHVCQDNGWPIYRSSKAYGELRGQGFAVDKVRLERLRMTANCIKHNDRELYTHHPAMFDPDYVPEGHAIYSSSWSEALRISNEDILDFFDAVRRSAMIEAGANRKGRRPSASM